MGPPRHSHSGLLLLLLMMIAAAAAEEEDPSSPSSPMDAACKWVGPDGHAVSLAPFKGTAPELYRHVDGGFEYILNLCGSVDSSA